MDDARIRDLTNEVLAALDAAVARLAGGLAVAAVSAPPTGIGRGHVSLTVLDVPSGGDRCVLEPDRPCTNSGTCRTFGH